MALVILLLISFGLAALPPAYGTLFEQAWDNGLMTDQTHLVLHQLRWWLDKPGRLLLAGIGSPYANALTSTHLPFWRGLFALVVANWLAWLGLFLSLWWIGRMASQRIVSIKKSGLRSSVLNDELPNKTTE